MTAPYPASWPISGSVAPDRFAQIQLEFSRDWAHILEQARQGTLGAPADRRFSAPEWVANQSCLLNAHAYLLSSRALHQLVEAAQITESHKKRLRFSVMQWVEAIAPSNFLATNPEVQKLMLDSNGASLKQGLENLLQDMHKGRVSQTDESSFEVGRNVATTEGQVVFENRLAQVIQYKPLAGQVYKTPLLIVPPCINKFYILDLRPENSFVRYALEQGFNVFLVSWRNPLASDADDIDTADWEDYLQEGVLQAIQVAQAVSRQQRINALGFCVGGTLLASALALAHAKGERPVESLTLLTTLLDFHDTGVLDVFVNEAHVQARERELGAAGLMSARELGTTFSFLRPSELVWNYVVGNYLKGKSPPAFDLLFWNADGTNLPGPFFTWYFRNTYLENNLKEPGRVVMAGVPLDLTSLSMPAYVYGSRDDHIVPWHAAYASNAVLRGPTRFVLGASGHIAGVINPPAKKRRHYWVAGQEGIDATLPGDPEAWLANAVQQPGSWWPDWSAWLATHSGELVRAPTKLGNARFKPVEAAPGGYVKVRAV